MSKNSSHSSPSSAHKQSFFDSVANLVDPQLAATQKAISELPEEGNLQTVAKLWEELAGLISTRNEGFTKRKIEILEEAAECYKSNENEISDVFNDIRECHKELRKLVLDAINDQLQQENHEGIWSSITGRHGFVSGKLR